MVVVKKRAKRLAAAGLSMIFLMLVATAAVPLYTRGPTAAEPMVQNTAGASSAGAEVACKSRVSLRVMTLNMAHGRKDGWHQALQKRATIESNLDAVVAEIEFAHEGK